MLADTAASLKFLAAQPFADMKKLGVTGFCWGGGATWRCCETFPEFKAGVAWYGPRSRPIRARAPIEAVKDLKAPVLGLYGGKDKGIPQKDVEDMRAALKAAGKTRREIIVYPDAAARLPGRLPRQLQRRGRRQGRLGEDAGLLQGARGGLAPTGTLVRRLLPAGGGGAGFGRQHAAGFGGATAAGRVGVVAAAALAASSASCLGLLVGLGFSFSSGVSSRGARPSMRSWPRATASVAAIGAAPGRAGDLLARHAAALRGVDDAQGEGGKRHQDDQDPATT